VANTAARAGSSLSSSPVPSLPSSLSDIVSAPVTIRNCVAGMQLPPIYICVLPQSDPDHPSRLLRVVSQETGRHLRITITAIPDDQNCFQSLTNTQFSTENESEENHEQKFGKEGLNFALLALFVFFFFLSSQYFFVFPLVHFFSLANACRSQAE
jgi:hypothetical protein